MAPALNRAGLAATGAAGAIVAFRKLPSAGVIRAVLDRHGALGGLLSIWRYRHWELVVADPARADALAGLAVAASFDALGCERAFVAAAFLMPDRALPPAARPCKSAATSDKLADQLQVLAEEQIVPPQNAKVLVKRSWSRSTRTPTSTNRPRPWKQRTTLRQLFPQGGRRSR